MIANGRSAIWDGLANKNSKISWSRVLWKGRRNDRPEGMGEGREGGGCPKGNMLFIVYPLPLPVAYPEAIPADSGGDRGLTSRLSVNTKPFHTSSSCMMTVRYPLDYVTSKLISTSFKKATTTTNV